MNATNKLVIDLEANKEIREYLATKRPGEKCKFEVEAALDESTDRQAVFSITSADAIHEPKPADAPSESGEMPMGKSEGPEAVMVAFGGAKY
jgi:hypothetical protein